MPNFKLLTNLRFLLLMSLFVLVGVAVLLPVFNTSASGDKKNDKMEKTSSGKSVSKSSEKKKSKAVKDSKEQQDVSNTPIRPVKTAVINMMELAAQEALKPKPEGIKMQQLPNEVEYEEPEEDEPVKDETPIQVPVAPMPEVVSPSPILDFEGGKDEAQGGGTAGTYNIPPDTTGAVGLSKIFTQLNNNYIIRDKATGAQLSLVSMNSFWSSLGADASGMFDPRVVYDPYNHRWIIAGVSNGSSASSRVLIALSDTSDPSGTYHLYSFDPDTGTTLWADFPMLGFNKNWVAISLNMFTVSGGIFNDGRVLAIDYPSLRNNTASATFFTGISAANGGFCAHPAETFSATEETLYFVSHIGSGGATYKISTLTGTPAAPTYTVGATKTRTGGGWSTIGGNLLPQQCLTSCPGTLARTDPGDQFIRNNVVFRNGFIWYAQTIGLPAGGAPTRSAVQWTKVDAATGNFSDGGRIDDPTATATNGGKWYGHPSIAVNKNNDVLIGFTEAESDGFFDAAYAFRLGTDAAGTLQDTVIYKSGEDYYEKDFGSGRQRWGDYSHTVVDPANDTFFWTVQEYAKLRAAPTIGGSTSKWGTWWAKVAPNACRATVTSGNWSSAATWGCGHVPTATDNVIIVSGQNVTLDVAPSAASITVDSGGTLTVSGTRTLSSSLYVDGTLALNGVLNAGSNTVTISCIGTWSGTSFVNGNVQKNYCSTGSFTFPVGTMANGNENSSFTANVTTLTTNPSSLTVKATYGTASATPALSDGITLDRYWTLTETGNITANITFNYLQTDIDGTESSYNIYRIVGGGSPLILSTAKQTPCVSSICIDTSANTMRVNNVTVFSDWTAGGLAPTASSANVSGRVFNAWGAPINNALVQIVISGETTPRYVRTNPFGYYRFTDIPVGDNYVVSIRAKGYVFDQSTVLLNVIGDMDNINFTASP